MRASGRMSEASSPYYSSGGSGSSSYSHSTGSSSYYSDDSSSNPLDRHGVNKRNRSGRAVPSEFQAPPVRAKTHGSERAQTHVASSGVIQRSAARVAPQAAPQAALQAVPLAAVGHVLPAGYVPSSATAQSISAGTGAPVKTDVRPASEALPRASAPQTAQSAVQSGTGGNRFKAPVQIAGHHSQELRSNGLVKPESTGVAVIAPASGAGHVSDSAQAIIAVRQLQIQVDMLCQLLHQGTRELKRTIRTHWRPQAGLRRRQRARRRARTNAESVETNRLPRPGQAAVPAEPPELSGRTQVTVAKCGEQSGPILSTDLGDALSETSQRTWQDLTPYAGAGPVPRRGMSAKGERPLSEYQCWRPAVRGRYPDAISSSNRASGLRSAAGTAATDRPAAPSTARSPASKTKAAVIQASPMPMSPPIGSREASFGVSSGQLPEPGNIASGGFTRKSPVRW